MLCQNFQTEVFKYRTRAELDPTLFGQIAYHEEIPPPYAESLYVLDGLFFDPNNNGRIIAATWTHQVYWPGWARPTFVFSADTGEFIEHGPELGNFHLTDVFQGAGGELYANHITGYAAPLGPNYEYLDDTFDADHFGAISFRCFMVDKVRDRMVMASTLEVWELGVYKFSDDSLIRRIRLPEYVASIAHADATKVYVLLDNKQIIGLDYETEQFFAAVLLPQLSTASSVRITYDKRYRRLLVCEPKPDNPDGSSATRIVGYRYRPIGVHVCKPIPLKRLRAGVKAPVLHKLIGDLGEGIASGLITSSAAGPNAQVTRGALPLDGDGEAVVDVLGLADGNDTISVSAEVECQL